MMKILPLIFTCISAIVFSQTHRFIYDLKYKRNINIVETLFKKQPIMVPYQKFEQLMIAYYNDPYAKYKTMKPGTWAIGRADETFVETAEGLREVTLEKQEDIRKNNNPIEVSRAIRYIK